jgi:hypothetical protein
MKSDLRTYPLLKETPLSEWKPVAGAIGAQTRTATTQVETQASGAVERSRGRRLVAPVS